MKNNFMPINGALISKSVFLFFLACTLSVPALASAGSYLKGIDITPPDGWFTVSQHNSTAPPEFLDRLEGLRPGIKQLVQSGQVAMFAVLDPARTSGQVKKGSNISLMLKEPLFRNKDELEAKAKSACAEIGAALKNGGNTLTECGIQRTSRYPCLFVLSHNAEGQMFYQALFVYSSEKMLVVTGTLREERTGAFRNAWNAMLDSISF